MTDERLLYFFSLNQPRRQNVIRQVLTNKRTVSNLFWGLSYQMLDWLGVAPKLDKKAFNQQIGELEKNLWLTRNSANELLLTPIGKECLQKFLHDHYWRHHPELIQKFKIAQWQEMLMLVIQAFSEMSYHNRHYYVAAVSPQIQYWFKSWLKRYDRNKLQIQLPELLFNFLQAKKPLEANIFISFFSGHQTAGKTFQQLVEQTGWTDRELKIFQQDSFLEFAVFLKKKGQAWSQLVRMFEKSSRLSNSSQASYQLFLAGTAIERIAHKRYLKINTIKEHLLEAAIFEAGFPFEQLITPETAEFLAQNFKFFPTKWDFQIAQKAGIEFFIFRLGQIYELKKMLQGKTIDG
jgi:uncharacterized protein YpbB